MDIESRERIIKFHDDFGLIILKFIQYFAVIMFVIGCMMVFLSIEKNKILPISFLSFGIFIFLFLIIEHNLFLAGNTEIDLEKLLIKQRHFFFREYIFDLRKVKFFIIERVISNNKVLLYNILMRINDKKVMLGQERDPAILTDKLRTITKCRSTEVFQEDKIVDKNLSPDLRKLFFILIPVVMFFIMKTARSSAVQKNAKIFVVILIPMSYFVFHYLFKSNGKNR